MSHRPPVKKAPLTEGSDRRVRIESIDVLRGIVMVLMALDHVRDFFGTSANPTDVARASAALFLTRWITHLCAPTFFLLTGIGAYLARQRWTVPSLPRFLFARGLWLIGLELTVLRCFGYQFNVDYRVTMLIILWAIGWSMIVLAGLVRYPTRTVALFGILLIAVHNLFDGVKASSFGTLAPVWSILHVPGVVVSTRAHLVFVAYPLVPWIGVTAAGYALGSIFTWSVERRRRFLLRLGASLMLAFVLLRGANVYGDPFPWITQRDGVGTFLSFLNATKYPPSLLYLLMTLGPALLLLRLLDGATPRSLRPARVFGRVPLFYFMLHLPLIHAFAVVVCLARYHDAHWMFQSPSPDQYPFTRPPGWGFSLPMVYSVWIGVVLILYPLCRWFAAVKARRTDWWLSYI